MAAVWGFWSGFKKSYQAVCSVLHGVLCNVMVSGLLKFSRCQIMSVSNGDTFTLLGHLFFLNSSVALIFNIILTRTHMKGTLLYRQSQRESTVIQRKL